MSHSPRTPSPERNEHTGNRLRPEERLRQALAGLRPARAPVAPHRADTEAWQKFIEVEMSAFNRRLARLEIMSLVLLILVVAQDLPRAADLLRHLITP